MWYIQYTSIRTFVFLKFRLPNWSFIIPRFWSFQNLIKSVSCFGFGFVFAFGVSLNLFFYSVMRWLSIWWSTLFSFWLMFRFRIIIFWFILCSICFFPPPFGNGGIGANFLGEPPAPCFARDLLFGVRLFFMFSITFWFFWCFSSFLGTVCLFQGLFFFCISCLYWCSANSVIRPVKIVKCVCVSCCVCCCACWILLRASASFIGNCSRTSCLHIFFFRLRPSPAVLFFQHVAHVVI